MKKFLKETIQNNKSKKEIKNLSCGEVKETYINGSNIVSFHYKLLSDIMKKLHTKIPTKKYDKFITPCKTQYREEFFQKANHKRAVIYLLSKGCQWALSEGNGCTMCGHIAEQTRKEDLSAENFIEQFKSEFNKIDFKTAPVLNVYNNGSFINDKEIPTETTNKILNIINNNPHIKMLVIETRPEFVTEEKIKAIQKKIYSKHVEIAIGLEIKDDFYRAISINKGFKLYQFNNAAEIITEHLNLKTYVLLKPPFLTEKEGIINAIETIKYAFNMGSSTVSLEACTVQNFTLVKWLYSQNLFRPPWLWSIIEVIKATGHFGKLIVGLFQFFPSPNIVPYNCPNCSQKVYKAIKEYNRSLDIKKFDGLSCSCKKIWKKQLKLEKKNLKNIISYMSDIIVGKI